MKMNGWLISAALAAVSARMILRMIRRFSYAGKTVLISGGSRGLGLVVARRLAEEGANLALLARSDAKLQAAQKELEALGTQVYVHACDIANRQQAESAVKAVLERFGSIDVLINDAGMIQVGPLETMTVEDFQSAMNVHFWGPLYLIMAVLPDMRQRRRGRIVNISSIGGKVSVPHLLPYCASKFALVGLSEGLRSELLKENVLVTTVCPGMMRTGSHINASFKGRNRAEYTWFSLGNALPFSSVSADDAAGEIVEATRRGDPELILGLQAQMAVKMEGLVPGLTSDILSVVDRLLPTSDGNGTQGFLGKESRSRLAPSFLTRLSDGQSVANNEI